jgi:hypothetical protein
LQSTRDTARDLESITLPAVTGALAPGSGGLADDPRQGSRADNGGVIEASRQPGVLAWMAVSMLPTAREVADLSYDAAAGGQGVRRAGWCEWRSGSLSPSPGRSAGFSWSTGCGTPRPPTPASTWPAVLRARRRGWSATPPVDRGHAGCAAGRGHSRAGARVSADPAAGPGRELLPGDRAETLPGLRRQPGRGTAGRTIGPPG